MAFGHSSPSSTEEGSILSPLYGRELMSPCIKQKDITIASFVSPPSSGLVEAYQVSTPLPSGEGLAVRAQREEAAGSKGGTDRQGFTGGLSIIISGTS
jgi:hypothetical protein